MPTLRTPNLSSDSDRQPNETISLPTLRTEYDVVIVGGGLSGLVAAYRIKRKAPALSCRILEATDRCGGQIALNKLGVDMGARWIGQEQRHVLQLCADLQLQMEAREVNGNEAGRRWELDGSVFARLAKYELARFFRYVDVLSEEYYPGSHRYRVSAGQTMESFLCDSLVVPSSRNVVRLLVRAACGCDADYVSLTEYMMVCNGTNGITAQLDSLTGTKDQHHIVPNFNQIINALLESVGKESILYETRLNEVRQTQNGIILRCANSRVILADAVVLAIPLHNVQKLHFFPNLPDVLVMPKLKSHVVMSFVCTFNREFWKSDVPTSSFMFHSPQMVAYPYDRDRSLAGLVFLDHNCNEATIKQQVLSKLVPLDQQGDVHCVAWNERCWRQSPILGLPTTSTWQRIVWAGTNAGQLYRGFCNGAVQGGMRAAFLVLTMMRPAVVSFRDLAEIQKANVVHRRSMGVWDRMVLSLNVYNSLRYFVLVPGCVWVMYCFYRRWDSF